MARPTTHGLRQLDRRRREHGLDKATIKILHDLVTDIADDAGGAENMTTRELWLAEGAAFAKFVIGQGMDYIVRQGSVFDASGQFHPVLGKYLLAWMNTLRLNLEALGLRPERDAKVPSLAAYLAERSASSTTQPPTATGAEQPVVAPVGDDEP